MKRLNRSPTLDRALDLLGGPSAAARALNRSPSAVSRWLSSCPPKIAKEIERLTDGKVRASELRPDFYGADRNDNLNSHQIQDELNPTPPAP